MISVQDKIMKCLEACDVMFAFHPNWEIIVLHVNVTRCRHVACILHLSCTQQSSPRKLRTRAFRMKDVKLQGESYLMFTVFCVLCVLQRLSKLPTLLQTYLYIGLPIYTASRKLSISKARLTLCELSNAKSMPRSTGC